MKVIFTIHGILPLPKAAQAFNETMQNMMDGLGPVPTFISNEAVLGTLTVSGINKEISLDKIDKMRDTLEEYFQKKLPEYKIHLEYKEVFREGIKNQD